MLTPFPYMTAKHITRRASVMRVTYVVGWEFYAPWIWAKFALWHAGEAEGMIAGGYRAIESLRLEKGYRYWSGEIGPDYTPYEAGLGFAVKLNKENFIGREALIKQKAEGLQRKLCCLTLANPSMVAIGNEPIRIGEQVVGWVSSGGYGYSVKKSIVYAYLQIEHSTVGTKLDVEVFGERVEAVVAQEPLWDAKNERVKA